MTMRQAAVLLLTAAMLLALAYIGLAMVLKNSHGSRERIGLTGPEKA